ADPVWSGAWRLNLPPPVPAAPPDVDAAAHEHGPEAGSSSVVAPMPGTVLKLLVEAGDHVTQRQTLVVLEAMKMETPLAAPFEATVRSVHVEEGDRVASGALLVELDPA